MGEPVTLYDKDGNVLNVYTAGQAEALLAAGQWYTTAAAAAAGKVRETPTPPAAEKLEALEGDTDVLESEVAEAASPPTSARKRRGSK